MIHDELLAKEAFTLRMQRLFPAEAAAAAALSVYSAYAEVIPYIRLDEDVRVRFTLRMQRLFRGRRSLQPCDCVYSAYAEVILRQVF